MHSSNLIFGYGSGQFNPQDKVAPNTMWCRYQKVQREVGNFQEECVRTAVTISAEAASQGRIPVVLLSGGLDSEVVVKAFQETGLPFRLMTFRYPNALNSHELRYVNAFLNVNKLSAVHEWVDIDVIPWAAKESTQELFTSSYCSFFEMVPHMHTMLHAVANGGYPVLGNGEALLLKMPDKSWHYVEYEYDFAWYRFQAHHGISGSMGFFQHTPEIQWAMLQEPRYQELLNGRNSLANALLADSREIKYSVYRDYWPTLTRRKKLDGGENLRWLFKPLDAKLTATYHIQFNDIWTSPVDKL